MNVYEFQWKIGHVILLWPMIIRNISGILWWYRLIRRIIVNVSCKTSEQFQKHYFAAIVHAFPVDHDLFTLIAEILNDNKDYNSFYFWFMLCIFDLGQVIFALQIKIFDAFLWTQTLHFIYCTTPWKSLWKLGLFNIWSYGSLTDWYIYFIFCYCSKRIFPCILIVQHSPRAYLWIIEFNTHDLHYIIQRSKTCYLSDLAIYYL